MGFISSIKEAIGRKVLKEQMVYRKRNCTFFNLNDASTIGILFDSTGNEDYELVKKYVTYLKELHKRVKVIGYCSVKEIPEFTYSRLEYEFFSAKELNWHYKPSGKFMENFVDEEFDILIDLNIYDHFPLEYIAAVSKARFKVGKFTDNNKETYDMMIETDETKSFKYFLRQVDIYLSMINKKASA